MNILGQETIDQDFKYFGPAKVLAVDDNERAVRVCLNNQENEPEIWARIAIPYSCSLETGQTALVAGNEPYSMYVIGIIQPVGLQQKPVIPERETIDLGDGAVAFIGDSPQGKNLHVISKKGKLVFEYDVATDKTLVNIQNGDLEFITQNGNIDFKASGSVRLLGQKAVQIQSLSEVRLVTGDASNHSTSSLDLKHAAIGLKSQKFSLSSHTSEICVKESRFVANKLIGKIDDVKLIINRFESIVNDVLQKAKNVYTKVEGLLQCKTYRMRLSVDATCHLKGKKIVLKADQDVKINGDKIHLG